jgi:hypothetical protein
MGIRDVGTRRLQPRVFGEWALSEPTAGRGDGFEGAKAKARGRRRGVGYVMKNQVTSTNNGTSSPRLHFI